MSYTDAPSILQSDKVCFFSGSTQCLEKHHVFGGSNRKHSAKYGLWVYLRHDLHNEPPYGVHHNIEQNRYLQVLGQRAFEEHYPHLNFIEIFGRNYT